MEKENSVLLSIIIPAYNCESFLAECLDSVLKQLPEDCELVVVDDGSEDATSQILKEYGEGRENLRTAFSRHIGASGARNRGLDLARGEYVSFLDCDDCLKDGFISQSRPLLEEKAGLYIFGIERAFLSGNSEFWTVEDRTYDSVSEFADDYIRTRHLLIYSNCNKFYQRQVIEEGKLRFDESVVFGEDRLFNYRYLTLLSGQDRDSRIITSEILMLSYIQRDRNSMSAAHVPDFFRKALMLHEAKMQCFFELSKEVDEDEKLDFVAYDLSREIEKTIDRFAAHPEEREETLPEINRLLFEGPFDDESPVDVLVILGSPNCGYKVDAAFEVGKKNPGVKYIVSGANLYRNGLCTEAEYMSERLSELGVNPSDIYLENRARYTKQNLEFSAGLIHELLFIGALHVRAGSDPGARKGIGLRVGMVTAGFHIPRTRLMAERMKAFDDFELVWFPAYGPSTKIDTWFETQTGRSVILTELRKTVKLKKALYEK